LYYFTNSTFATTGFFNTQITVADVNNIGSMAKFGVVFLSLGRLALKYFCVRRGLFDANHFCAFAASSIAEQNLSTGRTTSPLISHLSMVMRERELTYDEELKQVGERRLCI
jgi:hypothetical protein